MDQKLVISQTQANQWLIVKEEYALKAQEVFEGTEINITTKGRRHLGAIIGSPEFKIEYVNSKVNTWIDEVEKLSEIAKVEPHAAYAAYTHGMKHKFSYLIRTIPNSKEQLQPLEDTIRKKFIKSILNGYECNDTERQLLSLPPKFGGLGIPNVVTIADDEHNNSRKISALNVNLIKNQTQLYSVDQNTIHTLKSKVKAEEKTQHRQHLEKIKSSLGDTDRKCLDAVLDGSSIWLTTLPLVSHDFYLDKRTFWDAMYIRYNIPIDKLPSHCTCGTTFTVEHAMSCKTGGFIAIRHNDIRDLTAKLLSEVGKDVKVEPSLEPLSGEVFDQKSANTTDEARVDISVRGFWVRGQKAYCDVRVFSPIS